MSDENQTQGGRGRLARVVPMIFVAVASAIGALSAHCGCAGTGSAVRTELPKWAPCVDDAVNGLALCSAAPKDAEAACVVAVIASAVACRAHYVAPAAPAATETAK